MRDTFSRALYAVAKQNPRIFIVVADISPAASMAPYRAEFPDRFINVGVAEQSMIGLSAGLAMRGCIPFAYTIATFTIYRPFEQVRVDVCYQNLPVTLVGIGAGLAYSTLGGTHHAQEDVAVMSALPNMAVIAPCDPLETTAAVWACADRKGPTYLRLGKAGEPAFTADAPDPFQFGKIREIRAGAGVCIISYGPIMSLAFDAAAQIEAQGGGRPAMYSAHTLKPLDVEGVARLLRRYDRIAVVEEHSVRGGLAAQIKQMAYETGTRARVHGFSLRDEFIHAFGSPKDLWRAHGITAEAVSRAVLA